VCVPTENKEEESPGGKKKEEKKEKKSQCNVFHSRPVPFSLLSPSLSRTGSPCVLRHRPLSLTQPVQ